MDVGQPYPYCHRAVRQYRKSSIKHPIGAYLFQTHLGGGGGGGGGGGLNRDWGLKELECKAEKLKYKKLEVMQRRIKKNKSELPPGE